MLNSIFSDSITLPSIIILLSASIVLGILNALVYGYKTRHTAGFGLTLALLPTISAMIIFMVNDHLGVGVAVAGAFTLVRFRSVAGTGRQMAAILTSMALGLMLGMGYIGLAVIVFVIIALVTILLTSFGFAAGESKMLKITVPEDLNYDGLFDDIFEKYTSCARLEKVRTVNMGTLFELTYSINLKDGGIPKSFIDELRTRNGNLNVTICAAAENEGM